MFKSWLIYLLTLIGCYVFFLNYQMWFAWYLLVVVLLIPPIALILALVPQSGNQIRMTAPSHIKMGDEAQIKIDFSSNFLAFLSVSRVDIVATDLMSGEQEAYRFLAYQKAQSMMKIETKHCGAVRYQVRKIKTFDLFGLFGFSKKRREYCEVVVRPIPQMPQRMPDMNGFRPKRLRSAQNTYSEIYDVREYLEGDPIKNIHWKASAKRDALMVKDPQEECYGRARVFMIMTHDRDELDQHLGEMLFTSKYFLEHELPHMIRVMPPHRREVSFPVESDRDLEMAVLKILHMAIPEESENE